MSPDIVRLIDEGLVERVVQEATLLAKRAGKGQRHLIPVSEVVMTRRRVERTRDGQVLAILDLVPKDPPLGAESAAQPSAGKAAPASPEIEMLFRHDGPEAIPRYNIPELYGERAEELVRLLRGVLDEDTVVLHVPDEGEPLGVALAIALWRRALFHGHGWKMKQ